MTDIVTNTLQIGNNNLILRDADAQEKVTGLKEDFTNSIINGGRVSISSSSDFGNIYLYAGQTITIDVASNDQNFSLYTKPFAGGNPYVSIPATNRLETWTFTPSKDGYLEANKSATISATITMSKFALQTQVDQLADDLDGIDSEFQEYNNILFGADITAYGLTDIYLKAGQVAMIIVSTISTPANIYTNPYKSGDNIVNLSAVGTYYFKANKDGYLETQTRTGSISAKVYILTRYDNEFLSGIKYIYVDGTSGNDNNVGGHNCPVKTISKAMQLGNKIMIARGEYVVENANDLSFADKEYEFYAMHKNKVVFKFGKSVPVTLSGNYYVTENIQFESSTYKNYVIYNDGVSDPTTEILSNEIHPLQHGHVYRLSSTRYFQYQSESDLSSVSKGYYYDGSKFVIKSDVELTNIWLPSILPFKITRSNVKFYGIEFMYASINVLLSDADFVDCGILFPTSNIDGGLTNNTSRLYLLRTEIAGTNNCQSTHASNTGDGICGLFNHLDYLRNELTCTLIDCWIHDSQDDGYSDHGQSQTTIIGGLFEYNRKSGAMPSSGSNATIIGTTSRHQNYGFASVNSMQNGNADDAWMGIEFIDCLASDNTTANYGATNEISTVVCRNCLSVNSPIGYQNTSNSNKMTLYNCYSHNDIQAKSGTITVINGALVQ